jgi:predicted alpha/beta superfamily hydrolase
MQMRGLAVALLAGLILSATPKPAPAEPVKVVAKGPAAERGATQLTVHSDRLGRDFQIVVSPPTATPFVPGQKFPAIYALDAGYGLAGPQAGLLGATGTMAPAYVVSIGYPVGAGHRNTDLLHNRTVLDNKAYVGGGGAAFEAFLLEDLKPLIEAQYPIDASRAVLFGHSFGGLFAANVLADRPDAFAGYVIGSASAWADPGLAARVAKAVSSPHSKRVYLAVGSAEDSSLGPGPSRMQDGFLQLSAALKARPDIRLRAHVYPGETHLSYYPRLVTDGFAFVPPPARRLDAPQVKLPAKTLARYVGVYRLPDGRKVEVTNGIYGLTAQVTGIAPVPLLQNGTDRFYAPTSDLDVRFDATGATLTGGGGRLRLERATAP